jgi:hypothetical protein
VTAPKSQLRADLWASAVACASAPWLLVLTVVLVAGPAALDSAAANNRSLAFLGTISALVEVLAIGFYGTQRVWLLRLYAGRDLTPMDAWRFTADYFRRFAMLAVLTVLPVSVVVLTVFAVTRSTAANVVAIVANVVVAGVILYVLDVLLTFVVPELTFQTTSAMEAWRSGRAMIRATWPESRWYVLAPGLALFGVSTALSSSHGAVWLAAVDAAVAGLLSLVFRGAILRYYLRLRPVTGDYEPVQVQPAENSVPAPARAPRSQTAPTPTSRPRSRPPDVGMLSADRAYFWNGTAWVPSVTRDGRMRWSGQSWAPVSESEAARGAP